MTGVFISKENVVTDSRRLCEDTGRRQSFTDLKPKREASKETDFLRSMPTP